MNSWWPCSTACGWPATGLGILAPTLVSGASTSSPKGTRPKSPLGGANPGPLPSLAAFEGPLPARMAARAIAGSPWNARYRSFMTPSPPASVRLLRGKGGGLRRAHAGDHARPAARRFAVDGEHVERASPRRETGHRGTHHRCPANPGVDGDVLPAVRAEIGDGLRDHPGAELLRPQHLAAPRVHGAEPAVGGAIEHQVAGGRDGAAHGHELFVDRPRLLARDGVPRHELAPMAAGRRL